MDAEHVINVGMTPHPWDNKEKPYYWVVMRNGCNEGFGWSKTAEQAWKDARNHYKNVFRKSHKRRIW